MAMTKLAIFALRSASAAQGMRFRAPLKHVTLLLGLAILMTSVLAAAGAEVPAQYRGLWCEARDGTYLPLPRGHQRGLSTHPS